MTTVRTQLEQALAKTTADYHRLWCPERFSFEDCKYPTCSDNRTALARAKAEPEGCICSDCPTCAVSVRECQCADEGRKSHSGWGQK